MSDVQINPGVRGQTRSTWRDETHLRGVLLRLLAENPDAGRDELEAMYLAKTEMVPALIEEALRRAFDNDWNGLQKPKHLRSRPTAEEMKEAKSRVVAAVEKIKALVLLDLVQPNGKKLRDCTGAECRKAGGWLVNVAKRVGDDGVVGAKLNEAEVASIFKGAK